MNDLEPLDPKLHELLSRERGAYTEDSMARDAVLRRIQAAIVLAPLAMGSAASAAITAAGAGAKAAGAKAGVAGALGWKGAAVVAVVAFGGGVAVGEVHRSISDRVPPSATSSSPVTLTPTLPPLVPTITPGDLPSAEPSAARAATPSATALAPAARPVPGDPNEERALVDTARTALARGRSADALTAIEEHTRRFPRGRLAEEREALAVQALALTGDRAGALARAARFRRAYPNSIFGSAVDRAVDPLEQKPDARP